MNVNKLFGLCIVFLAVIATANALSLDQLLNNYGSFYSDGSFNVNPNGNAHSLIDTGGDGWERFNFSISGSGASSPYTAIATVKVNSTYTVWKGATQSATASSATNLSFYFDGNYIGCDNYNNIPAFQIDLRIYQGSMLKYQNTFIQQALCHTQPIMIGPANSKSITGIDKNLDTKFEAVNLTLMMYFNDKRNYTIGAYIGDNKTASAYVEKRVEVTGPYISSFNNNSLIGLDFTCADKACVRKSFSLVFNSSQLKDLNLNNEQIVLKSITVDNHTMDYDYQLYEYNFDPAYHPSPPKFTTGTSFDYGDVYVTNYAFDKTHRTPSGKMKELGVTLNASGVSSSYNVEATLEDRYGEGVATQTGTMNSATTTLWFNGTDIYDKKTSGPYRLGYIRVSKNNQDAFYQVNKGDSGDASYLNFTSPSLPDLKVNDSDVQGNNKDINVTINNIGPGDAAGVVVSVFNSQAQKVKEAIIDKMLTGTSTKYTFSAVNLSSAFVIVDFENEIEETNESNNVAVLHAGTSIPVNITSSQPSQKAISVTAGQSKQFNVSATGTALSYNWLLDLAPVSASSSYLFATNYYNEGPHALKATVTNANGSKSVTWNINVTPQNMAVYAYTYHQNARVLNNTWVAINANISFDGTIKQSTNTELPAKINLTTNTVHYLNYSSDKFESFTTKMYFDSKLFTCGQGQNCAFTVPYTTSCKWDTTNSWNCTTTINTTTDYFRMYPNPKRIKINAYLAR